MIKAVVFDLGGVLIDWNPRYLYRELLDSEDEIEQFLANVCTAEWNHSIDLGRPWEDAVAELTAKHPDQQHLIEAYWKRWPEMLGGPIHESVDLMMELKARGVPLYALSNWNHETFQMAFQEFPFLRLFNGKIVSGEVKLAKPDPAIYELLLSTFKLNPRELLFIDDRRDNVQTAWDLGFNAVQFLSPRQLEKDLIEFGLIPIETAEHDHDECGHRCGCGTAHHHHHHDHDDEDEDSGGCCGGGCGCHH